MQGFWTSNAKFQTGYIRKFFDEKLEIFCKNLLQNKRKSGIIQNCMKGYAHPLSDGRIRGSRMNKGKG